MPGSKNVITPNATPATPRSTIAHQFSASVLVCATTASAYIGLRCGLLRRAMLAHARGTALGVRRSLRRRHRAIDLLRAREVILQRRERARREVADVGVAR